jgi:hypothetical protein
MMPVVNKTITRKKLAANGHGYYQAITREEIEKDQHKSYPFCNMNVLKQFAPIALQVKKACDIEIGTARNIC